MSAPAQRGIRIASSAVIMSAACGALLLLIWNLNRGLDLTDESVLLYFYRHPDSFLDRIYVHHFRLVRALVPSSLDDLYHYRLFKLVLLVAFTGMFAAAFAKWAARRFDFLAAYSLDPITLFFFMLTGTLLSYCHGSQILSYNDLVTVSLLAVATAGFLLDFSPSRISTGAWRFCLSFVVGVILLATLFVKWPAAVLLAIYYWLFCSLVDWGRLPRALLEAVAGTICGAVAAGLSMTDAGIGVVFSFARLHEALSNPLNLGPHLDPPGLLAMYAGTTAARVSALFSSPAVLAVLAVPAMAVAAGACPRNSRARKIALGGFLVVAAAAAIAITSDLPNSVARSSQWFDRYHVAELQVFTFVAAWVGACACAPVMSSGIRRNNKVILLVAIALVASLPAVGSIGTNNALLTQFIRHMAPLFAALAVTAAWLGLAARWRSFASVVCAVAAVLTVAQLAVVVLFHPYRLARPGIEQTVELTDPPHLAGLKVDAPTHAFIGKLLGEARRAVGDTTGMPMLAMFDIPGVIHILDGVAIGFPWFATGMDQVACFRIESDPASRSGPRLIVVDQDELPARIVECMKRAGIDLAAYGEVSRIPIPYGDVPGRTLRLLVPREGARKGT